ncbi:MAG: hypothetical protein INR67_18345, partial [Jatrophihabitans endophyticus]
MFSAVAFCPSAPVLVPEVAQGAAAELMAMCTIYGFDRIGMPVSTELDIFACAVSAFISRCNSARSRAPSATRS